MANLRLNLILTFIVSAVGISPILDKLEKLSLKCEINNSKYWELIDWYFERTPYIIATTIAEGHREKRDISTVFLMQLTKCECIKLRYNN